MAGKLGSKRPGNGGARPGSGKPKGSTNKLTGKAILDQIQSQTGKPFSELLVDGYVETINEQDRINRLQYEKLILSKVLADKTPDEPDSVKNVNDRLAELLAKASKAADNNFGQ